MSRDTGKTPVRGASQARSGGSGALYAGWLHHRTSALNSLERLGDTPLQTLMTALVVAIALALPTALLVALNNVQRLGAQWDANPRVMVYLHLRAQPAAIATLQQRWQALPEVEQLEYISPEQALQAFKAQSGFGDALTGIADNPLPPTLVVTPRPGFLSPEALTALTGQLAADPLVDAVDIDLAWVRRLNAIMALGRQVVLALTLALSLGVLLVIGNTIRLAIENRRDEIVVTKLVGGTNGFVRRPFLYTGAWYGAIGGLLACLLISLGLAAIAGSVRQLAQAYQSDFILQGLGMSGCLALVGASAALGLLGAWLAVGRHLSAIEPH